MAIKIQAPEDNQGLPKIYSILLSAFIGMIVVTLFFIVGYVISRQG